MHILATAPAKINLTLDMVGRRDDGYHLVHTVMQAIDLCETVEVWERTESGIALSIVGANLTDDENNTACKAVKAFMKVTGKSVDGIGIRLHKHVPIGAGLAGGSADAAAVIAALDLLMDTCLNMKQLCDIGALVGADVPFCIMGGTAVGTGTGTILSPLPEMPMCRVVVAKPSESISTAQAYRLIDNAPQSSISHSLRMKDAILAGNVYAVARELGNAFDTVTTLSGVNQIKAVMRATGTLGCQMTGSGSAVFGLFDNDNAAQCCVKKLRKQYNDVFLCYPFKDGAHAKYK